MSDASETDTDRAAPRLGSRVSWRSVAVALWVVPMVVIAVLVIVRPLDRTVTPLYHDAAERWWALEPLYDGPAGMNYLPHFAGLFTPFHALPLVVGDILWRFSAFAGLAAGLWLFCGALGSRDRWRLFALVSLIILPVSLPALQNGQANAQLGAVLLLAAWCLKSERWGWAAGLLWLAVAIKPLGLAAVGLAWAAYPQIWWRLALGLPLFAGLPFLLGPAAYAAGQYAAVWGNLRECSAVTEHRFADINGLLRTLGVPLLGAASLAVRAAAGLAFMGLSWKAGRGRSEPERALIWLGLATGFLMLFNPMNEANSYVILAPALGLGAGWCFIRGPRWAAWCLVGAALTMGLGPNLLRPWLGNAFALAWHPAMTLGFLALLIAQLWHRVAPTQDRVAPEGAS